MFYFTCRPNHGLARFLQLQYLVHVCCYTLFHQVTLSRSAISLSIFIEISYILKEAYLTIISYLQVMRRAIVESGRLLMCAGLT